MDQDQAEALALRAIGWLAADDDLLPVFLGSTGASVDDLRRGVGSPEFLGSVLDFILMDDAFVTRFCQAQDLPLDAPMRARRALPGGSEINWT